MRALSCKVILGLREARARITTRQRTWAQFASTIALCLIAGGLLLLLDGFVIWGIAVFTLGILASWLVGIWVVPGGVDAYYRRVSRVLRGTTAQGQRHHDEYIKELRSLTNSIASLKQSQEGEDLFNEILVECKMIDEVADDEDMGLDRVRPMDGHRRRLLDLVKSFEYSNAGPINQDLATLLVKRASVVVGIFYTAQQLLEAQVRFLVRIKPPTTLEAQHQSYIEVIQAYVFTFGDLYKAISGDSDNGIDEVLLAKANARHQEWRRATQAYSDELRLFWVNPRRMIGQVS